MRNKINLLFLSFVLLLSGCSNKLDNSNNKQDKTNTSEISKQEKSKEEKEMIALKDLKSRILSELNLNTDFNFSDKTGYSGFSFMKVFEDLKKDKHNEIAKIHKFDYPDITKEEVFYIENQINFAGYDLKDFIFKIKDIDKKVMDSLSIIYTIDLDLLNIKTNKSLADISMVLLYVDSGIQFYPSSLTLSFQPTFEKGIYSDEAWENLFNEYNWKHFIARLGTGDFSLNEIKDEDIKIYLEDKNSEYTFLPSVVYHDDVDLMKIDKNYRISEYTDKSLRENSKKSYNLIFNFEMNFN